MQPLQCDLQPPFIKVKSQSHTTLQGQVSIAQHPSRSSLNPICNHPSSRSCEVSHHPSRSSLNRAPPFKVKCQSRTTLHHFKTRNSICPYLGSIASQLPLIIYRMFIYLYNILWNLKAQPLSTMRLFSKLKLGEILTCLSGTSVAVEVVVFCCVLSFNSPNVGKTILNHPLGIVYTYLWWFGG